MCKEEIEPNPTENLMGGTVKKQSVLRSLVTSHTTVWQTMNQRAIIRVDKPMGEFQLIPGLLRVRKLMTPRS